MSPRTEGYEVLATGCHDTNCPTLYRDPASGRVGVRGYVEGGEQIVWMDPAHWERLRGTAPSGT